MADNKKSMSRAISEDSNLYNKISGTKRAYSDLHHSNSSIYSAKSFGSSVTIYCAVGNDQQTALVNQNDQFYKNQFMIRASSYPTLVSPVSTENQLSQQLRPHISEAAEVLHQYIAKRSRKN
ncbi:hypothetical protein 1 [Bracoviriform demolitoris]|uniref:Uncharacterized protein D2 n=1 Tax=Microplitis demolitor bracovirus (isolate Webb) TaxID=654919 RepID=YD2_MDBVW|nr:hypothetical protein 1 [Bracoviriform demolitoris]Q5I153.1 RecName: Full=Uncharacterized protein D2 [Microplitis demolitor bracovirus (isolate Webb)]AAW51779.1 hypothetical protein 1 [Bracoviriform demolitoris]KAG6558499.1 Segment D hypothetical protein [Microplitis demolitor]